MQNSTTEMKTIPNKYGDFEIEFGRINPFVNVCPETGKEEFVNIVTTYIPDEKLIEIVSYREFFNRKFDLHIEGIADLVFNEIFRVAEPKHIKVQVFLEGNEDLTDWNVTMQGAKKYVKQ